jgi:hypothetical protein
MACQSFRVFIARQSNYGARLTVTVRVGEGDCMGLITDQSVPSGEYEAVALPRGVADTGLGSAVFLRRSARPSRRAVLHLHDMSGSFAPVDLARWYNERGFHFYVTDLDPGDSLEPAGRRPSARSVQGWFATLDAACAHLREADGIDAIILSAQESAAAAAALWCDARGASGIVDALILSSPEFSRALPGSLDITCPVLVISGAPRQAAGRRERRAHRDRRGTDAIRLGQHVTWLYLDDEPDSGPTAGQLTAIVPGQESGTGSIPLVSQQRRRLFDEMGRWLGAYMYGHVRDQLL